MAFNLQESHWLELVTHRQIHHDSMFDDMKQSTQMRTHQCETETLIGCLLYIPQPGIEPTTYICALTKNGTHSLWCMG